MENVFKNKNFMLIFLGMLVSNIGNLFYSFAVSYWILDITNNNAIIQGTYLGVCGITFVLFSLIGGVLSDRFNKAKLIYLCDFVKAFLIAGSSVIILLSKNNVNVNIVILFVMGIVGNIIAAIFSPACSSILPLIVKEEQLQQANSYITVIRSLQGIIGLCLAGVLYSLIPITTLFFIVAICYFLSAISETFIKYEYKQNNDKLTLKTTFIDIKDGFKYIGTKKALSAFLPMLILINFFLAPITENFISYFVKTDVANNSSYLFNEVINPEMWGAVFSIVVSVASIIFGIVLSMKTINENTGKSIKRWLFAFSSVILTLSVAYIVFVDIYDLLNVFLIVFVIIAFIVGMILSFINIPVMTVIQTITHKDKLGKVSSILDMVSQGLIPIATFSAGFIINYFGCSILLIVCSLGLMVVSIVMLFNKAINNFSK